LNVLDDFNREGSGIALWTSQVRPFALSAHWNYGSRGAGSGYNVFNQASRNRTPGLNAITKLYARIGLLALRFASDMETIPRRAA